MTAITARQRWQRAYSDARYWPKGRTRDEALRWGLFKFFGPAFGRAFSAPFDRNIAAAAIPWYLAGGAPTPIAVYQPKGAADLAASYVNLINPGTYNATPGTAPTLDASGWVFTGAQYLNTGITPTLSYTIMMCFSNASGDNKYIMGATADFSNAFLMNQGNASQRMWWSGGTIIRNGSQVAAGVQGLAGREAYMNGQYIATLSSTGSAPAAQILIGNVSPGYPNGMIGKCQASAIWNTSTGHATWMPAVMAAVALI